MSQIEAGNLSGAVCQMLNKLGTKEARKLAAEIEDGRREISQREMSKFIEVGKEAELAAKRNDEDFNSTDYLIKRSEILVENIVNNPNEYAPMVLKKAA
ncbi:MAG: hypothetical protein WCW25_00535 [Patescibacteria group bacterium]